MKKQWIVTALLVVLCAAVPVFASEALPDLEAQVKEILGRLEKVEAYEERIAALERQVAELTSPPLEPVAESAEDVVTMTELEYMNWLEEEMLRAEIRVARLEALFESDDPASIMTAVSELLDLLFDFQDEHSRIVTTAPEYDQIQSILGCFVDELEPLRGIGEKSVGEAIATLTPIFLILMDNPDDLFKDCDLDALDAFGEQFFE